MEQHEEEEPKPGTITVKAVIKRADGTIEDLGTISEGEITLGVKT